jgi:hypothetical protein
VLQIDKDFVEIALQVQMLPINLTNILSDLHMIVILVVYSREKKRRNGEMKIRLNEDYYFWCCDWCDSENLVLWAKLQDGTYCGACHRPMVLPDMNGVVIDSKIAAGLC